MQKNTQSNADLRLCVSFRLVIYIFKYLLQRLLVRRSGDTILRYDPGNQFMVGYIKAWIIHLHALRRHTVLIPHLRDVYKRQDRLLPLY